MKKCIFSIVCCAIFSSAICQDIQKWKITDVEKIMHPAVNNDSVIVINFWATFCKPCVAEIPSFIKITDKYKNMGVPVKLYLVSLDLPSAFPEKIAAFAKGRGFDTNICWLAETNADYFCPKIDTGWSGSIPATLILNSTTGARQFTEGEMTADEFETKLLFVRGNEKTKPGSGLLIRKAGANIKQ